MNTIDIRKRDRSALVAELEKAGANFKGNACNCVFHNDKHPSAGIFQSEDGSWRFKCQMCAAKGDVWDIIAKNTGQPLAEVLKAARVDSGECKAASKPVKVYATIDDLKAACPANVTDVYQYTNPDNGSIDMVVIRCQVDSGKTFRQARPCSGGFEMKAPEKPWPIYNRGRIAQADVVVIVEGEKCVHVLHEYGITATTSPGGAGKAEYADWQPVAGRHCVLWPDNDVVGKNHMEQVETVLQKLEPTVRISVIDPASLDLGEKEDAADFPQRLKAMGIDVRDGMHEAIRQAKPKAVISGVSERIEAMIAGKLESVEMPWSGLTKLGNSIVPGTVTLLCGSPGASKSFMLLQALCFWLDQGYKAAVYMLEEDCVFHQMRALAQRSGIADITRHDWVKLNPEPARAAEAEHSGFINSLKRAIWTCDGEVTLDELAVWAEQRAKAGCRIICVDPVTAAVQTAKPWIADNEFLQKIKRVATEFECSFVLVTHPTKTINQPDMTALSGSAAYSRFAQSIFWLHAHEPKSSKVKTACGVLDTVHNRTVHILKARNGRGSGMQFACDFVSENLTLNEFGLIKKN